MRRRESVNTKQNFSELHTLGDYCKTISIDFVEYVQYLQLWTTDGTRCPIRQANVSHMRVRAGVNVLTRKKTSLNFTRLATTAKRFQ